MAFKNSLKIYLEKGFFPFAGRRLASGPPAEAGPAKPPRAPRLARPSPAPRRAWPASARPPASRRAPDRVRDCPPRGATRRRRPDTASTRRGSSGTAGHGLSSRRARPASHFLLLPSPLARTAPAYAPATGRHQLPRRIWLARPPQLAVDHSVSPTAPPPPRAPRAHITSPW